MYQNERFSPAGSREARDRIAAEGVSDARVLAAMREVPRHRFVPPGLRDLAHGPRPLTIGEGQTISRPCIVGFMTGILRLSPGFRGPPAR